MSATRRSRSEGGSVERKIVAVLVLALGMLGAVAISTVASTRALIAEAKWVAHTHVVIEQLETVLAVLTRLESDQRGYLLTGDERFVASSGRDALLVAATFADLRALTADDPRQQGLLERAHRFAVRRIAARDAVLEMRRREGLEAAIAALRRGRGRHLMNHVRALVDRMKRVERKLLTVRSDRADRRATITLVAIPASSVLAFCIIAAMSAWIRRDLRAGERAARALRTVSDRLNLALGAAQIGTWSWKVETSEVIWDDFIHPLFGLAPGVFDGRFESFLALVHPEDRTLLANAIQRALAGTSDFDAEYRVRWPDGSEHVIAARGEVVRDAAGEPHTMTGVCWDVTDEHDARTELRRLKEEADAANQAKSDFLTSMSHELRTPMNSIIGFSQLVLRSQRSRLDADDTDALQTVQRNAKHLLTLINQVLDLSRVEAGKLTLVRTRFDLGTLAAQVAQETRPLVMEKPITIEVVAPEAPVLIEGDETRVRQIVTNLAANAIKYTEKGTVTIRVWEDADADLGAVARVGVKDTGPGISAEDQTRLFQRFSRLDTAATRREGGTGLGLSLALELARMHGGRIEVASDGATGSDFVATLPLGWRRPAAAGGAGAGGAGLATGALTVLCVDDDPDVLTLLQRTLEESGYRVVLASSAEEALARAGAAEPDLVCLDLGLPDADGLAVVRRLREEPALACVPVVVVAAAGDEARAIEGGARRLLVKPIDPETLRATVAHVFASRVSSVLVVDDDADVRKLLRDTFERQGIGVAVAADGAEAIGRLREATPDVIVLDLAMPVMDGFEFLRATQDVPAWRDIPVVIQTGRDLDAAERVRLGGACTAILAKGRDDTVALVKAVTGGRPRTATPERERVATAAAV